MSGYKTWNVLVWLFGTLDSLNIARKIWSDSDPNRCGLPKHSSFLNFHFKQPFSRVRRLPLPSEAARKRRREAHMFFYVLNFALKFVFFFKLWPKYVPTPGIEPGPPGWEPGILTTRPYRRLTYVDNRTLHDESKYDTWQCTESVISLMIGCKSFRISCYIQHKLIKKRTK